MHTSNRPMNHERNDPPPRMMNHDRPPSSSNGNFNKTSPRNSDSSQISNHPHMYQSRRIDSVGNHNHMVHGGLQQPQNPQHPDNTNNNVSNSRIGVPEHVPISQRFPG